MEINIMGLYVGEFRHIRGDGPGSCRPLLLIGDGHPDRYNAAVDGIEFAAGSSEGGSAVTHTRFGVPIDQTVLTEEQGYIAVGMPGTWHRIKDCPDQPGPGAVAMGGAIPADPVPPSGRGQS